jgi:hypothetical protein
MAVDLTASNNNNEKLSAKVAELAPLSDKLNDADRTLTRASYFRAIKRFCADDAFVRQWPSGIYSKHSWI